MIDEPTAAAIAYGLNAKHASMKRVFVFNFGGATFDASILQVKNGVIKIQASKGYSNLGGVDIDDAMIMHCLNDIKQKYGVDLTENKLAITRLRK